MAARRGHSVWRWCAVPLLVLVLAGARGVGGGVGEAAKWPLRQAPGTGTCDADLTAGEACVSSGPAQWVHTLSNLDPSEGQGTEFVCTYDGRATLSLDGQPIQTADGELWDGMWQILYEGQTTHSEQGGTFVCEGGGTNSAIVLAGTYTVAPLAFAFDEAFQCADDEFDFDGATISAVVNNFCNPNRADVVSFTFMLGAGDGAEPSGTDAVVTTEPGGSEPSLPGDAVVTTEPGGSEPSLPSDAVVTTEPGGSEPSPLTGSTSESGSSASSSDGGLSTAALAAIAAAIIAVLAGAAIAISKLPGKTGPPPDAPSPPAAASLQPPASPTRVPPPVSVVEEPVPRSQLSEAEHARLEGIGGEMQAEVALEIEAYQRAKRERAVLTRILKQNLLKVFMKKVIETQKWISLDPKNLLSNLGEQVTPDSLKMMDRIFQKHDTSHDAEIISRMKAEVDRLQAEINERVGNVRYLRQEISKLNQRLGR